MSAKHPTKPQPKKKGTPTKTKSVRKSTAHRFKAPSPREALSAPSALGYETGSGSASVAGAKFQNKEILFDVARTAVGNFRINGANPILKSLRTKLAPYALYEFTKCVIRYVPRVGTGDTGDIIMAFNPNTNAVTPVTDADFAQTKPYVTGVLWMQHALDLMPAIRAQGPLRRKVVDYEAPLVANAVELNLYAYGQLFFRTSGVGTATDVVGRLWLEYEVRAFNPREPKDPELLSVNVWSNVGVTPAAPFGTAPSYLRPSIADVTGPAELQIRRPGSYLITVIADGTGANFTHTYMDNPTTVATTEYGATDTAVTDTPPPAWKRYSAADNGYWMLNGASGAATRALARKVLTISKPEQFDFTPTVASLNGLALDNWTVSISCFNGDSIGWTDDVLAPTKDKKI